MNVYQGIIASQKLNDEPMTRYIIAFRSLKVSGSQPETFNDEKSMMECLLLFPEIL